MASNTVKIDMITTRDVAHCRSVMDSLVRKGDPVAVDAEGENLSATGRLTLLQIGDGKGKVYVIDVIDPDDVTGTLRGRQLLEQGGVKHLLEHQHVLKVVHGCHNDSAALYCQFSIKLNNVFDTQCAHKALEMRKGIYFPPGLRLDLLIEKYCGADFKHASKDFQDEWLKVDKFWGKRPLPQEAIEYAAEDVVVIYPHLYNVLKRKLGRDVEEFEDLIFEELHCKIPAFKDRVNASKDKRKEKAMRLIFPRIEEKYSMQTKCDELEPDEYNCIMYLNCGKSKLYKTASPLIKNLEKQVATKELERVEEEVKQFRPTMDAMYLRLHPISNLKLRWSLEHPDASIRLRAKAIEAEFNKLREPRQERSAFGGHRGRGRGRGRRY